MNTKSKVTRCVPACRSACTQLNQMTWLSM